MSIDDRNDEDFRTQLRAYIARGGVRRVLHDVAFECDVNAARHSQRGDEVAANVSHLQARQVRQAATALVIHR